MKDKAIEWQLEAVPGKLTPPMPRVTVRPTLRNTARASSLESTMQIRLNGKERDVRDDITVADILAELNIHPERVAVLVNQEILKKPSYASAILQDGDAVEVLTAMAGGMGRIR